MATRNALAEDIISCRDILLQGRMSEHVLPSLESVMNALGEITIPSTRNIVEYCVGEAVSQIKNAELISAGRVLNLIHNLPLNDAGLLRWDIDYFLSMEVVAFLDNFAEVRNARAITLYVFRQIANQNLPDGF